MSNTLNEVIPPLDFQLGNQQLEAIDGMIKWYNSYTSNPKTTKNRFILTGFAGTGKTTLVKPFMQAVGISISSAAYGALSGRASQILNSKGLPASTIHSQIYKFTNNHEEALTGIADHINRLTEISYKFEDNEEYTKLIRKSIKLKKDELAKIKAGEHNKYSKWFILDPESSFFSKSLIVVDEASMIDKLMEIDILSFGVPVIFIGDPMQLINRLH